MFQESARTPRPSYVKMAWHTQTSLGQRRLKGFSRVLRIILLVNPRREIAARCDVTWSDGVRMRSALARCPVTAPLSGVLHTLSDHSTRGREDFPQDRGSYWHLGLQSKLYYFLSLSSLPRCNGIYRISANCKTTLNFINIVSQ